MKRNLQFGLGALIATCLTLFTFSSSYAQGSSKIDWSKDTVSMADANSTRNEYRNSVKGRATEKISLPVDKLKEILDACAAAGVTNVDVLIGKVRASDIAHFKHFNKDSENNDLLGIQVLIFRVPRQAFASKMAAGINLSKSNPLMLSLLTAGLNPIDPEQVGFLGSLESIYFSFGTICPPPTSCD